ncbi:MAG: DUF3592 domain-containing protein [Polyangiaceae bacterium]|nr:DUF3592 domain-containing protein [Polyangiaceae bacterium]
MRERTASLFAPPKTRPSLSQVAWFLVLALLMFGFVIRLAVYPELHVAASWTEQTCVVLDKRIGQSSSSDGTTYRPELLLRHEVGGRSYEQWSSRPDGSFTSNESAQERAVAPFIVGERYPCWYDPADPSDVVALRSPPLDLGVVAFLVFIGSFVAFGVKSLYYHVAYRGLSPEQVAVRAARRAAVPPIARKSSDPTVPAARHTRGEVLEHRLTPTRDSGLGLVLVGFTVVWTLPVYALVRAALGGGSIVVVLAAVVFVVPWIFLIGTIVHRLLAFIGIRPTNIEVSAHPLSAGETFTVALSQRGPLRLTSLVVDLVCEEEVRYRQGTDTRTESNEVYRRTLFSEQHLSIAYREPLLLQATTQIPEGAMHSFEVPNNAVTWKIVVKGDIPNFPDLARTAVLVVTPKRPEGGGAYRERGAT